MKILLLLLLSLSVFGESEALDLSKGHFVAGGSASGAVLWDKNGNVGTRFDVRPSFGYLPLDQFSLETSFKLLIDPVQGSETNLWGFGLAAYYYFNVHTILSPYVGFGGEVEWMKKEFRGAALQFPIGLLIGLNKNVAINIGIPIRLSIPNYDYGLALIEFPFGYYGLKAFF